MDAKTPQKLVSAEGVVAALPEFFDNRQQVLRMAKNRVIPCYRFPRASRVYKFTILFDLKEVRKKLMSYHQPAL